MGTNQGYILCVFLFIFWNGKGMTKLIHKFNFDAPSIDKACQIAKGLEADFMGETGLDRRLVCWELKTDCIQFS